MASKDCPLSPAWGTQIRDADSWLRGLSRASLVQLVGSRRARMFRRKEISAKDLINKDGSVITIAELRKKLPPTPLDPRLEQALSFSNMAAVESHVNSLMTWQINQEFNRLRRSMQFKNPTTRRIFTGEMHLVREKYNNYSRFLVRQKQEILLAYYRTAERGDLLWNWQKVYNRRRKIPTNRDEFLRLRNALTPLAEAKAAETAAAGRIAAARRSYTVAKRRSAAAEASVVSASPSSAKAAAIKEATPPPSPREILAKERAARKTAEQTAREATETAAQEKVARRTAERSATEATRETTKALAAKELAEKQAKEAAERELAAQTARETAETATERATAAAATERTSRKALERATREPPRVTHPDLEPGLSFKNTKAIRAHVDGLGPVALNQQFNQARKHLQFKNTSTSKTFTGDLGAVRTKYNNYGRFLARQKREILTVYYRTAERGDLPWSAQREYNQFRKLPTNKREFRSLRGTLTSIRDTRAAVVTERTARVAATRTAKNAVEDAAAARSAREIAETKAKDAIRIAKAEENARKAAERAAVLAKEGAEEAQEALYRAERLERRAELRRKAAEARVSTLEAAEADRLAAARAAALRAEAAEELKELQAAEAKRKRQEAAAKAVAARKAAEEQARISAAKHRADLIRQEALDERLERGFQENKVDLDWLDGEIQWSPYQWGTGGQWRITPAGNQILDKLYDHGKDWREKSANRSAVLTELREGDGIRAWLRKNPDKAQVLLDNIRKQRGVFPKPFVAPKFISQRAADQAHILAARKLADDAAETARKAKRDFKDIQEEAVSASRELKAAQAEIGQELREPNSQNLIDWYTSELSDVDREKYSSAYILEAVKSGRIWRGQMVGTASAHMKNLPHALDEWHGIYLRWLADKKQMPTQRASDAFLRRGVALETYQVARRNTVQASIRLTAARRRAKIVERDPREGFKNHMDTSLYLSRTDIEDFQREMRDIFDADPAEVLSTTLGPESQTSVWMAVNPKSIDDIFTAGSFKSLSEITKGQRTWHKYDADSRYTSIENPLFGLRKSDLGNPDRTIKYGFVADSDFPRANSNINMYGKIRIKFKDRVRSQSTFTIGNSLDNNPKWVTTSPRERITTSHAPSLPSDLNNPSGMSLAPSLNYRKWNDFTPDDIKNFMTDPTLDKLEDMFSSLRYVEAQIFGRLDIDDIEFIGVPGPALQKVVKEVLEKHKRTDIPIYTNRQMKSRKNARLRRQKAAAEAARRKAEAAAEAARIAAEQAARERAEAILAKARAERAARHPGMNETYQQTLKKHTFYGSRSYHERIQREYAQRKSYVSNKYTDAYISVWGKETFGGYGKLNKALWGGKPLAPDSQILNRGLMRSMRPISRERRVFRGDIPHGREIPVAGDVVQTKGWSSASMDLSETDRFGVAWKWDIRLPKGFRAITTNPTELETILPPGTKLRVLRVERFDDKQRPWLKPIRIIADAIKE